MDILKGRYVETNIETLISGEMERYKYINTTIRIYIIMNKQRITPMFSDRQMYR